MKEGGDSYESMLGSTSSPAPPAKPDIIEVHEAKAHEAKDDEDAVEQNRSFRVRR